MIMFLGIVYGVENHQKHSLKCNMVHLYDENPSSVNTLGEMFSEGIYYGRLRFNSFGYKWHEALEIDGVKIRENHAIAGLGGSLIYRSAYLNGFGVGAGLYVTSAKGTLDNSEAYLYKAGKDAFSRYDNLTDDSNGIYTFAQAYLEYRYEESSLKIGRQIFESFLTKSNDTKMIPNTFEGVTLQSNSIPDTSLKMAYMTRQKLRDHSDFHHLLAVGDDESDPYAIYTENDDSVMHFGLELSKLEARGIDDRLIIVEVKNESMDHLTLHLNYTAVPNLIASGMVQADYKLSFGIGLSYPQSE